MSLRWTRNKLLANAGNVMFYRSLQLLFSIVLAGCSTQLAYRDFEDPIYYANQDSGYCHPCENKSGLLLAIWPDGRILKARSKEEVGSIYIYGMIREESLSKVEDKIELLSKMELEGPGVPVDAGARTIQMYPRNTQRVDGSIYWYMLDPNSGFPPDIALREFMELEVINVKVFAWNELPRFSPPVRGSWP